MKRVLVISLLLLVGSPTKSEGASWLWEQAQKATKAVRNVLFTPREEGADLIGKVSMECNDIATANSLTIPHSAVSEMSENYIITGIKGVTALAHVTLATCFAVNFADWMGQYADLEKGGSYWAAAVFSGFWMLMATLGNKDFLPIDAVADAFDSRFPRMTRSASTTIRVFGGGLSVFTIPWVISLSSAHKKEDCLPSLPFREALAYFLAARLAILGGETVSNVCKSRTDARAIEGLEDNLEKKTDNQINKKWSSWRYRAGNFCANLSHVSILPFLVYMHRGWVAFSRTCEEGKLGDPNPIENPDQYVDGLNTAALRTGVGMGIAAFTLFPWFHEKGRRTGHMIMDYLQDGDFLMIGTFGCSLMFVGFFGGAVSDHFIEWALAALGPLVTAEGAVGALLQAAQVAPAPVPQVLQSIANSVLIPFVKQVQAANVHTLAVTPASFNPLLNTTNPSTLATNLIRTGSVMFALSFTSLVQDGIEGLIRGVSKAWNIGPERIKWLDRRIGAKAAQERVLLMSDKDVKKMLTRETKPGQGTVNPLYVGK